MTGMFEGWVVVCDDFVSADFGRIEDAAAAAERFGQACRLEHRVELASAHPIRGSQWDLPPEEWPPPSYGRPGALMPAHAVGSGDAAPLAYRRARSTFRSEDLRRRPPAKTGPRPGPVINPKGPRSAQLRP